MHLYLNFLLERHFPCSLKVMLHHVCWSLMVDCWLDDQFYICYYISGWSIILLLPVLTLRCVKKNPISTHAAPLILVQHNRFYLRVMNGPVLNKIRLVMGSNLFALKALQDKSVYRSLVNNSDNNPNTLMDGETDRQTLERQIDSSTHQ